MVAAEKGPRSRRLALLEDERLRLSPTALAFLAVFVLVVVIAVVASLVYLQVFAGQGPPLEIEVGYDGETLRILHAGGTELPPGDYRVLVDGEDRTRDARLESGTGTFTRGRVLALAAPAPVQGVVIRYEGDAGSHVTIAQRYAEEFVPTAPDDPWSMPFPTGPTTTPRAAPKPPREYAFPPAPAPRPLDQEPRAGLVYVAAADSSPIPPGTVLRCDGAGDEAEINQALRSAGTVVLLEGTFHLLRRVMVPGNSALLGQGKGRTVLEFENSADPYLPIEIASPYVVVRDLRLQGQGFVRISASHVRVRDVFATSVTSAGRRLPAGGNGIFFVWADRGDVEDVEFYACTAYDCSTHGFNMNQDADRVARTIRDTRFINCYAALCGYGEAGGSRSPWITGFDLQESQDLEDCRVVNCIAASNWESGFHFEPGGHVTPKTVAEDIRMEDCVSIGNGQRNTKGYPYTDSFMSGYYVHNDAVLVNCTSERNRNAGFFVHGGRTVTFDRCTDTGSTYGWKVVKDSHDITLKDCATTGNLEWGLWAADADRLVLEGFEQRGVTGKDGYQSMLEWYYGLPQYERPVTDSRFEIAADGTLPAIKELGANNIYEVTRL